MSRELAGYTSPHHEGAWSNTKNYTPLSVVTNNGSSYIAKKAVPAGTALNNSVYWGLLASVGSDPNISITKTGTSGLVDTYTWTDSTSGNTGTFTVTNGQDGDVTADVIATPYDNTTAYKIGNLLTYLGKQYYCIADAPAGTLPTNTTYFEEKSVADIIEMIKTGEITVGKANLANNFDSKMVLTDNSGYLYRTTGGSLEVGEQNRVKKIVGASVPFVNTAQNGNFENASGWAIVSPSTTFSVSNNVATITYSDVAKGYNHAINRQIASPIAGHKYLLIQTLKSDVSAQYGFDVYNVVVNAGTVPANVWTTQYAIISASYVDSNVFFANPRVERPAGTCQIKNAMVIDLTATFDTTVADRLYALEQAQAGTGIAKAKEILVKDYYPYNVTAFTHTKTSGKVNNGFNQLNETEFLSQFPNPASINNSALNNKTLWVNDCDYQGRVCFTKENCVRNSGSAGSVYVIFRYTDGTQDAITSITTLQVNGYQKSAENKIVKDVYMAYGDNGTYNLTNAKMCVSLSWDGERDGEYEPYQEWNYPVEDVELKGILSLDAQDNWVADGDEYLPSGIINQRWYEYTFTGNESITSGGGGTYFIVSIGVEAVFQQIIGLQKIDPSTQSLQDNTFYASNGINGSFNCIISGCSTTSEIATWLTGKKAVYRLQLATPSVQIEADPYTELQNDSNWGTEKWIDTRDVPMPVFSTCEYIPDLKAKEEVAPESPDEDGDYIMHRENGLNSYGSLSTWLSANGYYKMQDLLSVFAVKETVGGMLRHQLADSKSIDFANTKWLDLGDLNWSMGGSGGNKRFQAAVTGMNMKPASSDSAIANILCAIYVSDSNNSTYAGTTNMTISINSAEDPYVGVVNTNYNDATSFKNAMKGILFAFETN